MSTVQWYTVPDFADLFTLEEFNQAVSAGVITDYDGSGYYAKEIDGVMIENSKYDPLVFPDIADKLGATHVAWYNK